MLPFSLSPVLFYIKSIKFLGILLENTLSSFDKLGGFLYPNRIRGFVIPLHVFIENTKKAMLIVNYRIETSITFLPTVKSV